MKSYIVTGCRIQQSPLPKAKIQYCVKLYLMRDKKWRANLVLSCGWLNYTALDMDQKTTYYSDYLHLDQVLKSQRPASFEPGQQPAHDEMLFIIVHQAFELWFKQILFELEYVTKIFQKEKINDNSEDMSLVLHRLQRIEKIMELLNQQVTILDTMTPLDFLEFRNLLTPASGFQSVQFRLIEARLGLELEKRHQSEYYKRTNQGGFSLQDYQVINQTEDQPTIIELINGWLERTPFFETEYWKSYQPKSAEQGMHPFWSDYRKIYRENLTEKEHNKIIDFDYTFFETLPVGIDESEKERLAGLRIMLTPKAMRAALFIMLYRDFPVFQNSFRILDTLIEIDNLFAGWRHAHYRMVRRMIGMRVGTGNTSGAGYLEGAMTKHYIFKDLAGLSTFLIERKKLPILPNELIRKLGFNVE
jgi:tryptophan 2,3-dioxygenase